MKAEQVVSWLGKLAAGQAQQCSLLHSLRTLLCSSYSMVTPISPSLHPLQFASYSLNASLMLLERFGLDAESRRNPVHVSRTCAAMVTSTLQGTCDAHHCLLHVSFALYVRTFVVCFVCCQPCCSLLLLLCCCSAPVLVVWCYN